MTTTQQPREGAGTVQEWITRQVAQYVGMPPGDIDPDSSFSVYGLDSLYAVALCGDIEDHFDLSVPPTIVWDHNSVARLSKVVAAYLDEAGA